jgi:Na+/melibiose symporter-like transporter
VRPATAFLLKNKSLHYPVFRNFLLVRVAIIMALNMQSAIISYFVYYKLTYNAATHSGDPLVLGILGLCEVIPAVGFSLFSGHFVDIKEKKTMMTTCIIGYILLTAFLFFWYGPVWVCIWRGGK